MTGVQTCALPIYTAVKVVFVPYSEPLMGAPYAKKLAAERAAILAAFKTKARNQGIKVTDEMVAKATNPGKWNDRTMVTRWKRNDPKCRPIHDRMIRAVLSRDPSSIWPTQRK